MRLWPAGGLWRHPGFLRLWAAQIVSAFGSRITRTALPAVAILTLGASDGAVALLGALALVPSVVVGLLASTFIDRVRRRPLMIACDLLGALAVISIPLAAWAGVLSMAQVFAVALLANGASALFALADQTLLPDLVGRDHLEEGNAKLSATDSVAEIAGPSVAGGLIQAVTAPFAIVVHTAALIWSVFMLSQVRVTETPHREDADAGPGAALRGLRAVARSPILRALFAAEAVLMFGFGFLAALYMLFALRVLDLEIGAAGLIISVGGIGALAGALVGPPLARRFGVGPSVTVLFALAAAASLLVPLATGDDLFSIGCLVAAQLVGDAAAVAYFIQSTTLRQMVAAPSVLGRVNAALLVMHGLVLLAGALVAAPLAEAVGIRGAVWTGAGIGLCGVLPLLLSPVLHLRRLDELQPTAPATPPSAG